MYLKLKTDFLCSVSFANAMVWATARNSEIRACKKKSLKEFSLFSGHQVAQTSLFNLENHSVAMSYQLEHLLPGYLVFGVALPNHLQLFPVYFPLEQSDPNYFLGMR